MKMVSPRSRGEDIQSAANVEAEFVDDHGMQPSLPVRKMRDSNVEVEFVDVHGLPFSLPVKKMRGSLTNNVASGRIPSTFLNPIPISEAPAENRLAMVLYDPSIAASSKSSQGYGVTGKESRSEPSAVRDCPLGFRIRGGRQMPPIRQAAPKPVENCRRPQKRKVDFDPACVTILSDSDSEEKQVRPSRHSTKPCTKKDGEVLLGNKQKGKKQKHHRMGETQVNFDPTVDELKPDAEPRTRVKYFLNQFDNLRRMFLAQEDERVKDEGSGTRRADHRSYNILTKFRSCVNGAESIYGEVPGVEVGDHYFYRLEMLLISLHRQTQAGIDYIPENKSRFCDVDGKPVSVAVSVIASGGYEDDIDEGETLTYTGQGGNAYVNDRRQGSDQELKRGNLALKNSKDLGLAVRVIRGGDYKKSRFCHRSSPSGRIYYYDGLYDVVDCYQERGSGGYLVWKYRLVRKQGQRPLSSKLVIFKGKSLTDVLKCRGERILSEDLSGGLEPVKVRVVGSLDDNRIPNNFKYINSLRYSSGMPKPLPPTPCACSTACFGRNGCKCMALNGDQPYNDEGGLLRAKRLVYECGPTCSCVKAGKCINRVAQRGLRYELEVFKTRGKGWGVRSSYFIPQGSFVCEYIGEIIHESDAEKRVSDDEYMFDLKIPDSMERRFGEISGLVMSDNDDDEDDANCEKYTVDANRCGNLARFVNHSCDPNLFVQCVLYDHHDHRFPHIMLFASEHIPPYKELTYDYGYKIDAITGKDGKIKKKKCCCASQNCRGRMY